MDETGQCWEVENPHVRFRMNITWGRPSPEGPPPAGGPEAAKEGKGEPPVFDQGREAEKLKRQLTENLYAAGLTDNAVADQTEAFELPETWAPIRVGDGSYIREFRCRMCGWPSMRAMTHDCTGYRETWESLIESFERDRLAFRRSRMRLPGSCLMNTETKKYLAASRCKLAEDLTHFQGVKIALVESVAFGDFRFVA
jgi:hypothetical protein